MRSKRDELETIEAQPAPSALPSSLSSATVGSLTERELIERIQERLPPSPDWMPVGIGDDAAVVEPERNRLEVLTVDALVEGIHFDRAFTPAEAIGHRALAVNLSDLAAMGASPRLALVSLALPATLPCREFERLVSGLTSLATRYKVHVAGGNLTRSPGPLMVDITVVGTVKRRQVLTRASARPGDDVYVTGTLGAAAAGLQMLRAGSGALNGAAGPSPAESCVERYLRPEPRVRVGVLLGRNRAASACIDLSDGLADGVQQIAHASGVGMIVDAAALPVDKTATRWFESRGEDPIERAVVSGDDYELLFTVRPRDRARLNAAARHREPSITRVGVCTAERAVLLRRVVGERTADAPFPRGYTHFR